MREREQESDFERKDLEQMQAALRAELEQIKDQYPVNPEFYPNEVAFRVSRIAVDLEDIAKRLQRFK